MKSKDRYYRPIVQVGPSRPQAALPLAGGWGWFTHLEVLAREESPRIIEIAEAPSEALETIIAPRGDIGGLSMDRPRVMGILNATPDSFSDGGLHEVAGDAVAAGVKMRDCGADILDIGGESTRPGAVTVPPSEEIERVVPVIEGLRSEGVATLISIDTRKSEVGAAAVKSGAGLINDVSGFTFDAELAQVAAASDLPVCAMHAQGNPETMHHDPRYEDVLLDVYDFLAAQIKALQTLGIPRHRILADPGIGFGKTLEHNLALLARISLFHSLGVPLLLGVSRKRFIGTIGDAPEPRGRMPGSIAVALSGLAQGVQVLRVHDVPETVQAIALWRAAVAGEHL